MKRRYAFVSKIPCNKDTKQMIHDIYTSLLKQYQKPFVIPHTCFSVWYATFHIDTVILDKCEAFLFRCISLDVSERVDFRLFFKEEFKSCAWELLNIPTTPNIMYPFEFQAHTVIRSYLKDVVLAKHKQCLSSFALPFGITSQTFSRYVSLLYVYYYIHKRIYSFIWPLLIPYF